MKTLNKCLPLPLEGAIFRLVAPAVKLLMIFSLCTLSLKAANLCVGPTSTGNGSGSSWSNRKDWSDTPTRGDVWYLADGSYDGKVFNTAESSSTLITIKKATISDHATATGWSDSLGDGQAVFNGQIKFATSYWEFDGQTGGGRNNFWTNAFGFKIIQDSDDAQPVLRTEDDASFLTFKHVEMVGIGEASTWGGSQSNDGMANYGGSDITLSYAYIHDVGRCIFFIGASDVIIEYTYTGRYYSLTEAHAELASIHDFSDWPPNNVTFRYNLFTHVEGTGGLMYDNQSNPTGGGMIVHGCIFNRYDADTWEGGNGVIGGWTGANGEQLNDVLVYNNTFINLDINPFTFEVNTYSGCVAKNNLFYNCPAPNFANFDSHDYNAFISSGGSQSETHEVVGSSDPFVSFDTGDFHIMNLTTTSNPRNRGDGLGGTYNTDMDGRIRGADGYWDIGAYEYQWLTITSMGVARSGYTATLLADGKVLFAGGASTASAEIYDPASGMWSSTGAMTTRRSGHTATLLANGKVLVAGGDGSTGNALASAELFDPAGMGGGSWTATGNDMPGTHSQHTATLLPNGKVLVAGGLDLYYIFLSTACVFDPAGGMGGTGSWSSTAAMSDVRCWHAATLLNNGKVLVTGGYDGNVTSLYSSELFDYTGNSGVGTWSSAGNMPNGWQDHAQVLTPDGKVWITGGNEPYGGGSISDVAYYDPAGNSGAGAWGGGGGLLTDHGYYRLNLLSTGNLLLSGGIGGCELYDLVEFIGVPCAPGFTSSSTATLLLNGKVLCTGGGSPTAAELYTP